MCTESTRVLEWIQVSKILLTVLPGLVIGVLTAVLANRLTLNRFYTERWWERKADTYSKIMESLYHMVNFTDQQMRDPRTIDKEVEQKLLARSVSSTEQIDQITSIGAFIISKTSANRLISLRKELEKAAKAEGWYEYLGAESNALDQAIRDMRELAKNDLHVK